MGVILHLENGLSALSFLATEAGKCAQKLHFERLHWFLTLAIVHIDVDDQLFICSEFQLLKFDRGSSF